MVSSVALSDLVQAVLDGTRTDNRGRNPSIDPMCAGLHLWAMLKERGVVAGEPSWPDVHKAQEILSHGQPD